jgi:hypothetical protein
MTVSAKNKTTVPRRFGNWLLDTYGNWRAERYDTEKTIVVACTGRGGSTWLAQIIASLPRHHLLWEQLHWRTNPECQEYGFGRPLYLTRDQATSEQTAFVQDILTGRTLPSAINTSRYFHPWDLFRLRAYVAKFVTANMLLPWLVETFGVRAVFMIRHPCAVVASQMKHGRWGEVGKSFCEHPTLFDDYPHLGRTFDTIDRKEEVLAFNWAIQNFIPLSHSPSPWITTTYESLVANGMEEVTRIFRGLGESIPEEAQSMLNRSSATAIDPKGRHRSQAQLAKWQRRLSPLQIDRILHVVHDAGVTIYSEDLLPTLEHPLSSNQTDESE